MSCGVVTMGNIYSKMWGGRSAELATQQGILGSHCQGHCLRNCHSRSLRVWPIPCMRISTSTATVWLIPGSCDSVASDLSLRATSHTTNLAARDYSQQRLDQHRQFPRLFSHFYDYEIMKVWKTRPHCDSLCFDFPKIFHTQMCVVLDCHYRKKKK
jgi:hypothetical protein